MIAKLALASALALGMEGPPQPLSLNEAIHICRTIYFIDPDRGAEMFEAVPDEQKKAVAAVCIGYRDGAADMQEIIRREREKEA